MTEHPEVSIVMPAYNERSTIVDAIHAVVGAEVADSFELIVVDDGSTDGTRELLEKGEWPRQVRVLRHDVNRGKGAALQTGVAAARGAYTTIMDADLELAPSDIPAMLEPLRAGKAVVVFGARRFDANSAHNVFFGLGNRAVTWVANVLFGSSVSDIMTGQKAMQTELFRSLELRERGFGIEPEITARLLQRGVVIHEVPVDYRARSRKEGKKLTVLDGLRVVRTLLRCRFA